MKRNSIFSEEIYKQVNQENIDILEDYTLEMKSNGKGEKTIYQYRADIKMFFCWLFTNAKNKNILELKKREFRRFFLEMKESGASSARINRVQCSLRNMLEYCAMDDDEYEDYEINVMKYIKGIQKEEVRTIHFITNDQVEKMLEYLIENEKYQLALYLAISYESAGRRNEVFQIQKEGFLENKMTNEVVGKRAKKFKLLYFNKSREIAKLYFDQRGEDNIESLWITGKDETKMPAKYETLYSWTVAFRDILEKVGEERFDFNPHSFRHSSLTNFSDGSHYVLKELGSDKLDLNVLKSLAHHSSIDTTQGYLPNMDEQLLVSAFGLSE